MVKLLIALVPVALMILPYLLPERKPKLRAVRVLMDVTLWQLKEQMANLNAQMGVEAGNLAKMAADPASNMEDMRKAKQHVADMKERYTLLKEQHDEMEAAQRASMQHDPAQSGASMSMAEASGVFYRTALMRGDMRSLGQMAYQQLGANPAGSADNGGGENLLPTNLSTELVTTPMVENPIAALIQRSQITGLEEPVIEYEVDNDDFVADGATARELKLTAGTPIKYGRNPLRLKATIADSIVRGAAVDLSAYVNSALHSALANKELKLMFAESPASGQEHMSFYGKGLKEIAGATMLDAILNAYGDLEDAFVPNARVVMRKADYFKMLRELNGNNNSFWGKKPEDVIGIPVTFCERATTPIVGDFRFVRENFDNPGTYETDKDIDKGLYKFVLAVDFDIQIKLASAFRLAIASGEPTTNNPDTRLSSLTIGDLTLSPSFDPDTLTYTAKTTAEKDAITVATKDSGATAAISNAGTAVVSGADATWTSGTNRVTVTVTKSGAKRVYKIVVTK